MLLVRYLSSSRTSVLRESMLCKSQDATRFHLLAMQISREPGMAGQVEDFHGIAGDEIKQTTLILRFGVQATQLPWIAC